MEFWHTILIASIPGIIVIIYKLFVTFTGFSPLSYTRPNLDISVIEQYENEQKIKIKMAYIGIRPLIIKRVELKSTLDLRNVGERFRSWFQLSRGHITDDVLGLQTVLGQKYSRKEPVWLRKIFNIIFGILLYVMLISFIYNPFGWISLLLFSAYNSVKIRSSEVNVKELQPENNRTTPFLIKPAEEKEFLLIYTFSVRSKSFKPTKAEVFHGILDNPLWKLPRPGHHILRGNVKLIIQTSGWLSRYCLNLGKKDFRLIPLP